MSGLYLAEYEGKREEGRRGMLRNKILLQQQVTGASLVGWPIASTIATTTPEDGNSVEVVWGSLTNLTGMWGVPVGATSGAVERAGQGGRDAIDLAEAIKGGRKTLRDFSLPVPVRCSHPLAHRTH